VVTRTEIRAVLDLQPLDASFWSFQKDDE
jgi:hypothetical protein